MLRQIDFRHLARPVIGRRTGAGENGIDEVLHEFNRVAQQQMVLPGALLDADEQFVVFLHERLHQGTVIRRQQRHDDGEDGGFRQIQLSRDQALALFAFGSCGGDDVSLIVDGGNARQKILSLAAHHQVLLVVEPGEHFAVLLQFFAQGFNEVGEQNIHGCWTEMETVRWVSGTDLTPSAT